MPLAVVPTVTPAGFTAAITGSTGAAVTVWSARFDGTQGVLAWEEAGNRTGDGSVTVAAATGHYWVGASTASLWSVPSYAVVRDADDAIRTQCLTALAALIRQLGLPDLEAVRVRHRPEPAGVEMMPDLILMRADQPDDERYLGFEWDRVGYPFLALFRFRDPLSGSDASEVNAKRADKWFQGIARSLRNQPLAAVPEVWQVRVRPLTEIDPAKDWFQGVTGGMVITCDDSEPRGFGA